MKNKVAEQIYRKFIEKAFDLNVIGHLGKRDAISKALKEHSEWFETLKKSTDQLNFLESLPWIGPITKHHLARNLGLDYAKPDRHLVALACQFDYATHPALLEGVQRMCSDLAKTFGMRIGTVDLILWRFMSDMGEKVKFYPRDIQSLFAFTEEPHRRQSYGGCSHD